MSLVNYLAVRESPCKSVVEALNDLRKLMAYLKRALCKWQTEYTLLSFKLYSVLFSYQSLLLCTFVLHLPTSIVMLWQWFFQAKRTKLEPIVSCRSSQGFRRPLPQIVFLRFASVCFHMFFHVFPLFNLPIVLIWWWLCNSCLQNALAIKFCWR